MGAEDKTPCTVWHRKRDHYLDVWRRSPEIDLLRHPKLMFYFAAYKCFADIYLQMLENNSALSALRGADFWSRWELLYLGRKLFDVPKIKAGIYAVYEQYERRFGNFLGDAATV